MFSLTSRTEKWALAAQNAREDRQKCGFYIVRQVVQLFYHRLQEATLAHFRSDWRATCR